MCSSFLISRSIDLSELESKLKQFMLELEISNGKIGKKVDLNETNDNCIKNKSNDISLISDVVEDHNIVSENAVSVDSPRLEYPISRNLLKGNILML